MLKFLLNKLEKLMVEEEKNNVGQELISGNLSEKDFDDIKSQMDAVDYFLAAHPSYLSN